MRLFNDARYWSGETVPITRFRRQNNVVYSTLPKHIFMSEYTIFELLTIIKKSNIDVNDELLTC